MVQESKRHLMAVILIGGVFLFGGVIATGIWVVSSDSPRPAPAKELIAQTPALLGPLHSEKAGGFEFNPPANWQARSIPGFKYELLTGPVSSRFAPNINVVDEVSALSLDNYVNESNKLLAGSDIGYVKIQQSIFETESGVKGIRLLFTANQGRPLRFIQYCFQPENGRKLIVTCTAHAEVADSLDSVFDASMMTFRIEEPKVSPVASHATDATPRVENIKQDRIEPNEDLAQKFTERIVGEWTFSDTADGGFWFGKDEKCFVYSLTNGVGPMWGWETLRVQKGQIIIRVTSQSLAPQFYSGRFDGDELILRKMNDETDFTDDWGRRMRRSHRFEK